MIGNFFVFGTAPASDPLEFVAPVFAETEAMRSMLTCSSFSTELRKRSRKGCLGPGVESS